MLVWKSAVLLLVLAICTIHASSCNLEKLGNCSKKLSTFTDKSKICKKGIKEVEACLKPLAKDCSENPAMKTINKSLSELFATCDGSQVSVNLLSLILSAFLFSLFH